MRLAVVGYAFALSAIWTVPSAAQPSGMTETAALAPAAQSYLDEAITAFRTRHINRAKVDWESARARAMAAARGAKQPAETYPAIRLVIDLLGEKHTKFVEPERARAIMSGSRKGQSGLPDFKVPEGERIGTDVGLIRQFSFMGPDEQAKAYVEAGQRILEGYRTQKICRIILDLRSNGGGNMYPMLDSVTAILDDGTLGWFEGADGQRTAWVRRNGFIDVESRPVPDGAAPPAIEGASVAVLIGNGTASSGEFVAISFVGRPQTRSFGAPTRGLVTGNEPVFLSDGAMIAMTTSYARDRTGKLYTDKIIPDQATADGEPTVDAALAWLRDQPCDAKPA